MSDDADDELAMRHLSDNELDALVRHWDRHDPAQVHRAVLAYREFERRWRARWLTSFPRLVRTETMNEEVSR